MQYLRYSYSQNPHCKYLSIFYLLKKSVNVTHIVYMYIWPHLLTPKYFISFFKAENVSTLTVTSNLILGEKPHTVAGLTINTSISLNMTLLLSP